MKQEAARSNPTDGSLPADALPDVTCDVDPQETAEWLESLDYVIQSGGLFPHLTARDNVTLAARQLG